MSFGVNAGAQPVIGFQNFAGSQPQQQTKGFGFNGIQQPQVGFGQTQQTGFAQPQQSAVGFGQTTQPTVGFGQPPAVVGFGQPVQQVGFGANTQPATGTFGFNSLQANTANKTTGFGFQPSQQFQQPAKQTTPQQGFQHVQTQQVQGFQPINGMQLQLKKQELEAKIQQLKQQIPTDFDKTTTQQKFVAEQFQDLMESTKHATNRSEISYKLSQYIEKNKVLIQNLQDRLKMKTQLDYSQQFGQLMPDFQQEKEQILSRISSKMQDLEFPQFKQPKVTGDINSITDKDLVERIQQLKYKLKKLQFNKRKVFTDQLCQEEEAQLLTLTQLSMSTMERNVPLLPSNQQKSHHGPFDIEAPVRESTRNVEEKSTKTKIVFKGDW